MLPDLVKELKSTPSFMHLNNVSSISTIAELLSSSPFNIRCGKVSSNLTTATAESSFSSLRRLKTYLRSTTTQSRLNNILLLHCHKEMTDAVDLTAVAPRLHCSYEKRKTYFEAFS